MIPQLRGRLSVKRLLRTSSAFRENQTRRISDSTSIKLAMCAVVHGAVLILISLAITEMLMRL